MDDNKIHQFVKQAKHGDKKAFERLFKIEREYMYKTAFLYMKNKEDALDIVQECVVRCVVSIGTLREPKYFKTWLTRILIRCAMDEWRRRQKYQNVVEIDTFTITGEDDRVSKEEVMDLYRAIDQLEFPYKAIIIQKYFFDYKLKEIAEMLDMPLGTIKAYHSKAKQQLKDLLMEGTL